MATAYIYNCMTSYIWAQYLGIIAASSERVKTTCFVCVENNGLCYHCHLQNGNPKVITNYFSIDQLSSVHFISYVYLVCQGILQVVSQNLAIFS